MKKDDKMKTLLGRIKSEKQNKNNFFDNHKELEIELVRIKDANLLNRLQSELKELHKILLMIKTYKKLKMKN